MFLLAFVVFPTTSTLRPRFVHQLQRFPHFTDFPFDLTDFFNFTALIRPPYISSLTNLFFFFCTPTRHPPLWPSVFIRSENLSMYSLSFRPLTKYTSDGVHYHVCFPPKLFIIPFSAFLNCGAYR